MSKREYCTKLFRVTYTLKEEGPHPTIPHDYYDDTCAITAILQGGGVCSVEGTPYILEPGTLMVLSPEEIRSFRLHQTGCHERISVYFTGSILTLAGDTFPVWTLFGPHSPKRYSPRSAVQPILERIRQLLCGEDPLKEPKMHLCIMELLFALYDADQTVRQDMPVMQDEKTTQICQYIKNHLTEDLSYDALQQQFLVSRYQLTEVFRRSTGLSLTEYVIMKRLTEAASRIREGVPMELAAEQAGFCTYSHFYKVFKKRYGVSPRQYSKNALR